jgi:hypothetical protein
MDKQLTPRQAWIQRGEEIRKKTIEEQRIPYEQWMSKALDISVDAARDLTRLIKGKLEGILDQVHEVHQPILEAHDRRAWQPLGYPTWEQHVKKEFNLSRSRSYQLLDRARVIQALFAAGLGAAALQGTAFEHYFQESRRSIGIPTSSQMDADITQVDIPARAVQRLKPRLAVAQDEVKQLVSSGTPPSQAIQTVIDQHRRRLEPEDATPVTQIEASVRPVGHEDKVHKFRDAVMALYEFLAEDDTTLNQLLDDAIELADGSLTQDHILGLYRLLARLGY